MGTRIIKGFKACWWGEAEEEETYWINRTCRMHMKV